MPVSNIPDTLQRGRLLLELPKLNKGTAFTREERIELGLLGMIPYGEESLDSQIERAYQAYSNKESNLEKHIYLRQLQDLNEVLFFKLIICYASEMLPVLYTPTVGDACEHFSEIYRKPHGLFLNYPEREFIDDILSNISHESVEVIVVTDGEAILGIGDQGVGGMGIPIGKLSLYSALGGIDPKVALPIVLDVGTNNQQLLNDPLYVGWKNERIRGQEYDDFVELVLTSIHRKWPDAVIQFEDFGTLNSQRLLDEYIQRFCCFNDDIQGTAAITVGCLIAACRVTGVSPKDSTIVIAGAGAAGSGIAKGCVSAMVASGLDYETARRRIYMLNRDGLIHSGSNRMRPYQKPFVRELSELTDWKGDYQLLDTVRNVRPNVLIGVSGQNGIFSEQIVREMAAHAERPCIFPLSNPTSKIEAVPEDLLRWTDGRAVVATGSPFDPVSYGGVEYDIAQCNNAYAFPGIGLGLIAVKARRVTDEMFTAVAHVIGSAQPDVHTPGSSLLPPLGDVRSLSREIAIAVAKIAVKQGLSGLASDKSVEQLVDEKIWNPGYQNDVQ